jgi:hypothetical protein
MAWHIVLKLNRTTGNYFRALEAGVEEGCGQLTLAPHLKREFRHCMSDQLQFCTCSKNYFAKLPIVMQSNREDVLRKLDLKKCGQRFDVVKMPKLCPGVLHTVCNIRDL